MHDDPIVFAARDRVSQVCGLVILGFAAVATLANLLTKRLVLPGGDTAARFAWAVAAGTGVGLTIGYVAKYNLDRRFVFRPASPIRP